jgi:uncharacterized membrane protein
MEFLAELHPRVVHFPVALLCTYSILEITGIIFKKDSISKTAHIILLLGVIAAFFAVLTGNEAFAAYKYWTDESKEVYNHHQTFANLTVWFSAFVLFTRTFLVIKKKFTGIFKYIFVLIAALIVYFVIQTGEFGGELVYKYGVGTETSLPEGK